ncbi:3-alpha-hydroxysteroid dehydrogenase, partial [Pseudomonas sp. CrR7]|nr:3-alpha-hydroxysteroid dehydrogenase [Pseudomonas sp. CM27]
MSVTAISGSASGIGAAVSAALRAAGHEVIGIDRSNAEVIADLSTAQGRQ